MKRTIIALTTIFTLAGAAVFAQSPVHDSGKHVLDKKDLKDSVGLSDKQADSVIAIHKEFEPKIQQLKANGAGKTNKSQIEALHQQEEQRLAGNLTPEQLNKLEAYDKAHKGMKKAEK